MFLISKYRVFFLWVGLFLYSGYLMAQKDSIVTDTGEDSIVYIYEAPIVIQKHVTHWICRSN
jgi:hypothetical protein